MKYLGDYIDNSTVRIYFTTNDGSGGAVAPSTAFEAADVVIYKNSSATQKTTTNGVTMTSPFDTVTGLHLVEIDMSNDTGDAGFWATGNDYSAILSPDETVDSQTVVAPLGQWSNQNRTVSAVYSDTTAVHSQTTVIESDSIIVESSVQVVESQTTVIESDSIIVESSVQAIEAWGDPSSDLAAIESELIVVHSDTSAIHSQTTVVESDSTVIEAATGGYAVATLVDDIWDEVLNATHNVASSAGRRLRQLDAAFEVHSGTAQAGSTSTTFVMDTGADGTNNDIYRGDRIVITGGTGVSEHGIITSYTASTRTATMSETWVVTPDNTSEFSVVPADVDVETWNHTTVTGTGDMAQVESDLLVIESDTTAIHSQTTVIESDSIIVESSVAVIESESTVIQSNTEAIHSQTTVIESDSIVISSDTAAIHSDTTIIASDLVIVASDVAALDAADNPTLLISTTIATLASQTSFTLTAGSADNDAYNHAMVIVTDAATANQVATGVVKDYVASTKTITLQTAPAQTGYTMAATDSIAIVANPALEFLYADKYIDDSVTPWDLVYMRRGTGIPGSGVELLRQNLTQSDDSNVTATTQVVANAVE